MTPNNIAGKCRRFGCIHRLHFQGWVVVRVCEKRRDYFEVTSVCKISCTRCCDVRDSGVYLAMLSQCRTLVCLLYDELVRLRRQAVVAHFTALLDGLSTRDCLGGQSLNPGPSEKCYTLRHNNGRESACCWLATVRQCISLVLHPFVCCYC